MKWMIKLEAVGKRHFIGGILLMGMLLVACHGGTGDGAASTADSVLQQTEGDGVPLNNLERTKEGDTLDSPLESNSGVPLDNFNRDNSSDSVHLPVME